MINFCLVLLICHPDKNGITIYIYIHRPVHIYIHTYIYFLWLYFSFYIIKCVTIVYFYTVVTYSLVWLPVMLLLSFELLSAFGLLNAVLYTMFSMYLEGNEHWFLWSSHQTMRDTNLSLTGWEKIFSNHIFYTGLVSRIYKEYLKLIN